MLSKPQVHPNINISTDSIGTTQDSYCCIFAVNSNRMTGANASSLAIVALTCRNVNHYEAWSILRHGSEVMGYAYFKAGEASLV